MDNKNFNIGERIRYYRNLKNWSQMKLANEANINTAFLGHLERNIKHPTVQTLEKLTSALGISLSEFFDYEIKMAVVDNSEAIKKIELAMRGLSKADCERIADIVCEMAKLGNS